MVVEEGQIDLLSGAVVVAESNLQRWLTCDPRVMPLHWRILTQDGVWIPSEKSFPAKIDAMCSAAIERPDSLPFLARSLGMVELGRRRLGMIQLELGTILERPESSVTGVSTASGAAAFCSTFHQVTSLRPSVRSRQSRGLVPSCSCSTSEIADAGISPIGRCDARLLARRSWQTIGFTRRTQYCAKLLMQVLCLPRIYRWDPRQFCSSG
jgi:hypothetical protein